MVAGTIAGAVLALLVIVDWWTRPALIGAFALYLSYVVAGQDFMSFQWDALLLEVGFLAIFVTGGSRIVIWLYRWLVFRYLLLAGAVKLLSGDASWQALTALDYHFWTQPLPSPPAWYAAELPHWVLVGGTTATLVVELGIVFLVLLPRRPRAVAAWCVLLFQALIMLTGNYNFFNLLTMLMCVFLFDDAALRRWFPPRLASWVRRRAPHRDARRRRSRRQWHWSSCRLASMGSRRLWRTPICPWLAPSTEMMSPLRIVNRYGLFAVMTTSRPEIVIEGSVDGQTWREYEFRYKPGPLARRAPWTMTHQPRLDWQMWFAALGDFRQNPWFVSLMLRLLQGSPPVLALLDSNPFPDGPPKFVRAKLYDYRFTDQGTRAASGQWWSRTLRGMYFPQVSLANFARCCRIRNRLPDLGHAPAAEPKGTRQLDVGNDLHAVTIRPRPATQVSEKARQNCRPDFFRT